MLAYRTELPFVQVWVPPWAWRELSYPIALAASVLLATGLLPPSHLRKHVPDSPLLGVILWSLTHLMTNGDLASILFFGSVAGLAGVKIFLRRRKAGLEMVHKKQNIDSGNLLAISRVSVQWDIAAILLGMVVWGIVVLFHGQLFGVGLDLTGY